MTAKNCRKCFGPLAALAEAKADLHRLAADIQRGGRGGERALKALPGVKAKLAHQKAVLAHHIAEHAEV